MPILTTDLGRNATTNASVGGFLVDLFSFAVTEKTGVKLSVLDSSLEGVVVNSGRIESIEVVSNSTVKCTIRIPVGKPATGEWNLTEIGLYLKSGVLFAHGTFKKPFKKSGEFGLKTYVFVTCDRLGEVINVTVGNTVGLDSTVVRHLSNPAKSGTNAVVVQDAMSTSVKELSAGAVAVRYGAGGANWSFLGHDMVYRGRASSATVGTFGLDIGTKGGFWLDDQEVIIVSVAGGKGAGESRRARYTKDTNSFAVLEEPFSQLDTFSVLHIWRETKNQVPKRHADIPAHYVLMAGRNDWDILLAAANPNSYNLVQGTIGFISTGVGTFNLPASVPNSALSSDEALLVFVAGKRVDATRYSLSGRTIALNTPPGVGIEVVVVYYEQQISTGSQMIYQTAEYADYAPGTKTFQLISVPANKGAIMVFVDELLVAPTHYNLVGSAIVFSDITPDGPIALVSSSNFYEPGAKATMVSSAVVVPSGAVDIAVSAEQFEQRNSLVTINGQYLSKDKYTVSANSIKLNESYPDDVSIEITIVTSAGAITSNAEPTVSGFNSGPVWADPAGLTVEPNTLTPVVLTYSSTGGMTYAAPPGCPDKDSVLVFVGGQYQKHADFTYDKQANEVRLSSSPASGIHVDVIGFTSVKSKGSRATCKSFTLSTNGGVSYNIAGFSAVKPLLIFVGGVYQHASQYTMTSTLLTFTAAPANGVPIEAWVFHSEEELGSVTVLTTTANTIAAAKLTYNHDTSSKVNDDSANLQNSLVFAATVYQAKNAYTLALASPTTNAITFGSDIDSAAGKTLTSIMLLSGKGQTRLITRDEFEQRNAGVMDAVKNNGWAILPSGMMIQVARGSTVTGNKDKVYFPVQFPNKCLIVITSESNAVGWTLPDPQPTWHGAGDFAQDSFNAWAVRIFTDGHMTYSPGISFNYVAIGF